MSDFCPKHKPRPHSPDQRAATGRLLIGLAFTGATLTISQPLNSRPGASRRIDRSSTGGFTLLEVLVVLTLVGLLTAFSLPQFSVIRDRVEFTLNRETFERDLDGLSYLAFKEGRPLVLAGQYPRRAEDTADDLRNREPDNQPLLLEPGQLRPSRPALVKDAPLNLPAAWEVAVENPIYYQTSGFCSGGAIKLKVGNRTYAYDVKAPLCQVQLK